MDQESETETLQPPGADVDSQQDNGTAGKVDELPSWAQELVKSLRSEAAANRKAKKDAESATVAAKEKELAEQNAWKELADQRQAKLAELEAKTGQIEPLTEKLGRYEAMLYAQVESQLKAVPDMFKPLLAKLDLTERIEWLVENAEKLSIVGVPTTPRPAGQMNEAGREEARKRQAQFFHSNF
jgi:hypothetical protein